MGSRSWAASGRTRRPAAASTPRAEGSWGVALARALDAYAGVGGAVRCLQCGAVCVLLDGRAYGDHTGHPGEDGRPVLSDVAASAVLSVALALWADTAATMAAGGESSGD